MEIVLLIIILVAILLSLTLQFINRGKSNDGRGEILGRLESIEKGLSRIENNLKEDFKTNREESLSISKDNRLELNSTLKDFRNEIDLTLKAFDEKNNKSLDKLEITIESKMSSLIEKTEKSNQSDRKELTANLKSFSDSNTSHLDKFNAQVQSDFKALIEHVRNDSTLNREVLNESHKNFQINFDKNFENFKLQQHAKFEQLEEKQNKLIEGTEKKLEEMRVMVDEKLQRTLNERLGQSFAIVNKQLESVQKGLGEMQTIAQDVGGLKKVLSNVKMRGGIGEVQLAMLLEQVLAPEQYQANVKTKQGSSDLVEFAIKLPGRDDGNSVVWLPIDAKFPKDVYEYLQTAYDGNDATQIDLAHKNLENTIKKMAKDIRDKYIDPPHTTDFGILFLPFEGIYAEVVRKASLLHELQSELKIIVTGPTTLAAILNSLQMGFKTLAIQKRSSEVWKTLGNVKKEFETFGELLDKAHKSVQAAGESIEKLRGTRTNAIIRQLNKVESLPTPEDHQGLIEQPSAEPK